MVVGRWPWVSRLGVLGVSSVGFIGKKRANLVNATRHGSQTLLRKRFAYARLLAYMARIDNELTVDEMAMFEQRLDGAAFCSQRESIRAAPKNPPSLRMLGRFVGRSRRLALRDAVMMAAADGTVDEDERDALETSQNTWV